MDYADNFNPKPIKGEKYTTTDGKVVIVDDIQPDEGVVYVFCHYEGDAPNTMYPNKEEWEEMFSSSSDVKFSVRLSAVPSDGGSVTGVGQYEKDSNISISATPSNGYKFIRWSDNDTQSLRTLVITSDLELKAHFEQIPTGGSNNISDTSGDSNNGGGSSSGLNEGGDTSSGPNNGGSVAGGLNNGGNSIDPPFDDQDYSEYLRNVVEPLNKLRKLLQHGLTLPFQILRLETEEEIPAQFSDPNVTSECQDKIEKIEKLRKEGEKDSNRGSWFEEKMWSFGAFDKPMLRMFKEDHNSKTGLGLAIFMTSLLAFCTGTYAFYKVSDNTFLAFIAGGIWASMIYVLDRNIVTSMDTKSIWKSLRSLSLRLIISVFIGFVISTPIELLIFNGKINEYKDFEHKKFVENYLAEQTSHDYAKIGEIQNELDSLKKELKHEETVNPYGVAVKGRIYRGPRYNDLTTEIKNKQSELQTWKNNINTAKKIDKLKYEKEAEEKWKEKVKFYDLSRDLEILHKVTAKIDKNKSTSKDGNPENMAAMVDGNKQSAKASYKNDTVNAKSDTIRNTGALQNANIQSVKNESEINPALPEDNTMWICSWFITIFFIMLEIIPVITKLFFKASAYDREMERWAYLKHKLHCIEDASSYNQIVNGALSVHREYIMGERYEEVKKKLFPDGNFESNDDIVLPVKGCLRTAKDYLDAKNLATWKASLEKANAYLLNEIEKLFPQMASTHKPSQPVQPQQQPLSTPVDPSAGGETID